MAVNDPLLRYATDEFSANGTQTDWEISFVGGYINPDHVFAMSVIKDPATELDTDRTTHSLEIVSTAANAATVRISPAVAAGRTLFIYRSTPVDEMLVDYVEGSALSKKNLNLANDQLLKIVQEMFDNLNITTLSVDQQVGTIVDLNKIIREIYEEVLKLVAAGGIVSVAPRVWAGSWTGDQEEDDQFFIPGADVTQAGFYDVYMNGLGLEPAVDYEIIVNASNLAESAIRFAEVPAPGSVWFAVLRGYAKPYTGPQPVTVLGLRLKVVEAVGPTFYADKAVEFGFIRCTNVAGCEVRVNIIPAVGDAEVKMGAGSHFSIAQKGGPVTVTADSGVIIDIPAGCIAQTRGVNSVISLTCEDADTNTWTLSGDLAKE